MPVRGSWEIKGLEEYLEAIQQAERDVDSAAAEAVAAGGDLLLQAMVDRVPVGQGPHDPHPGALKEYLAQNGKGPVMREGNETSIEVGLRDFGPPALPSWNERVNYYRTHRSKPKHWAGQFFYGVLLEFGTSKMAARPWFRPAIEAQRARVKALWREIFQRWGLAE